MDASEATRLARAASPYDADYEDGSVPLQLPLSCADHLHRSAKRRLSPPADKLSLQRTGNTSASLRALSGPAETKRLPCLDGNIYAGERDRPSRRQNAHLTECRNERRRGRAVTASNAICRGAGTNASWWRHR